MAKSSTNQIIFDIFLLGFISAMAFLHFLRYYHYKSHFFQKQYLFVFILSPRGKFLSHQRAKGRPHLLLRRYILRAIPSFCGAATTAPPFAVPSSFVTTIPDKSHFSPKSSYLHQCVLPCCGIYYKI